MGIRPQRFPRYLWLGRETAGSDAVAITGDREPQLLRAVEEPGADAVLLKEKLVETLIDRLQHVRHTEAPG